MPKMSLLFSIDDNFVDQWKTTLYSIYVNTPHYHFDVYLLSKEELAASDELRAFCHALNMNYIPILMDQHSFDQAPVSDRYPESIYYRLLAHHYLPEDLDRILYLDADILAINSLEPLWDWPLGKSLYAAASHTTLIDLSPVNKVRLNNFDLERYYNSGVLLMNLPRIREEVSAEEIFQYIEDHSLRLLLPDQDVLNALYSERISPLPDAIYNYDTRYDYIYDLQAETEWSLTWVIQHTILLHFCGLNAKDKPWAPRSKNRYAMLYKHYMHRSQQILADPSA